MVPYFQGYKKFSGTLQLFLWGNILLIPNFLRDLFLNVCILYQGWIRMSVKFQNGGRPFNEIPCIVCLRPRYIEMFAS